ncbi:leukotoxin LktA family filamentous adhesin [Devosia sp.]|uniref:leukotoxin LktA family filamentous adhesin n=1 Tax=Devosia sp. TaxID=1871048 RepID=UPI0026324BDA|nr:leukotoxin LktA family filamentous adhesin [Devosia sp.]
MAGAAPGYAQAVNLGGGNNIVADGRTQTQVTVSGNQTSITTNTVANGTGFNSFSDFQQAANTRVDMYVPDGAGNLVNIVRNGPVVIDGVLNAYKNGQIGGNIFFASSQGFIVGANGVVNVGSLSVTTPTSDFIENVIRPDGGINDTLAANLLRGVVPLSADGIISIAGTINAKGGVSLQGHDVNLDGGTIRIDGRLATHREILDSAVNTGGVVEGTALAMRGGVISIVASGNAHIAGVIDASARGTGDSHGGSIEIRSGGNITVDGTARLSADAASVNGGGGTIEVIADDTLLVADNARFTARGTGIGAGGFVELSGKTAIIRSIAVDLDSERGAAGTLLFDPFDLYIGTLPPGATGSVSGNIVLNGTNAVVQADNSITVVANGVIDTRSATGASGDISITAPLITIADGARLQADVTNGSGAQGGNITLTATRTTSGESRIVIGTGTGTGPIIAGHNVSLLASANVDSGLLLLTLPTAKATISVGTATITASGIFRAEATASAAGTLSVLPIGVVVSNVLASVDVGGSADITAASAALRATATATSRIGTTSLAPPNSAADGAVAVSTVTSKALVNVAGNARVATTGALELAAHNTVISAASAVPQAARFGASVAVSVVKAETSAIVAGAANISSGSLSIDAQTSALVKVTAQAAAGGGSEPDSGSKSSEYLDDSKYGQEASTSDGKVSVVGGLAISDLTATTLAKYASSVAAAIGGDTTITAGSTTGAELVADGAAVDSTTGVGVAVGINLARVSTAALAGGSLGSGSLTLASVASGNVFSTEATSGAGAENVGVAGSLATNIIDTESRAALEPAATIDLTGDLSLTASNASSSAAIAKPTETGVTGGKVGVGVSAALNVVANRATAEVADGVVLTGADATTLAATGEFSVESEAKAGSSGGISVTPALALNMVSNATTARVGTGGLLTLGSLDLSAVQQASNKATVTASAAGSKAAVGAGLAIALLNDTVTASLARSVTATGSVSVVGMGVSLSELTVEASASGAKAADDTGNAPAGSKPDVDSQVTGQLGSAKTKQDKAGVGSADQRATADTGVANGGARSASTSEGKVSVAAAVGVNVQSAKVVAQIEDAVAVSAGGALTVRAVGNADGKVTASGSAVSTDGVPASQVGIGAAVAVNKVATATTARLGVASYSAGAVTVEALKADVAALLANPASTATRTDTYLASATSGAGGSKVGIAGSLGLNLIDTESSARIAAAAIVTITGAGAVSLKADNRSTATAEALPVETGATGGKVGVGVSAAINIIANRSIAELEDTAVLTGAGAVSLNANGNFTSVAEGKAGASGGVSITPALGLNLIGNTTSARIGTGATMSAGSVAVSAVQQATTTTKAAAAATGATAAIGASLALALVNDTVSATTARSLTTTGNVSFTAQNKSVGTLSAEASAAGAKPAGDSGQAQAGDKDVDGKVNDQLTGAKSKQTTANVGSSTQQGATSQSVANGNARSAKTSEGKLSVAAAAAINVTTSSAIAEVPDAVAINAGGTLSITSANTTGGTITADGSAVGASSGSGGSSGQSQVGIGVAVAVNAIDKTNTARLGVASHVANGVTVAATQFGATATPDIDTISATAASGAGGSKVGIAGSLALNVADVRTSALIAAGATVNAGTGASVILADTRMNITASAQPIKAGATGGKVGVGASVALNMVTTNTSATLADGASFSNGAGLAVSANSAVSTTTKSAAGSAGGVAIDAVVALALLNDTTTARIGTSSTAISTAGAVSVSATSSGDHLAEADGNTKSGSVGLGAAAAVILGAGAQGTVLSNTSTTSATLARNVTAASLAITASSIRTYTADATATAKGGQFSDADPKKNETTGGTAASADTLDKTKNSQQGTSGGGKVTVAAAVGVAAAQDVVSANLQGVTVNTTGAVTIGATNTVGMATGGSGLAVNSQSQVGVGIGVALGIINNSTSATIADGSRINQSGSVAVTATTSENTAPAFINKATAVAIAGASSSKVSVAGALAVAISTSSAKAAIGDNVAVNSGGAVNVAVDNSSKLSARSLAGAYTSGNVGVGASIASIYSQHTLSASVGAGASVTSASLAVTTNNRKVNEPSVFTFTNFDDLKTRLQLGELLGASNYYAEAMGGAAATGSVAVQGSFAVLSFDDSANASIGRSLNVNGSTAQTTVTTTGAVTLKSESDLTSKAMAGGIVVSKSVGVGVSSAVIVSSGTNRALFAAGTSVTAGSVTALAKAGQDVQVFGITASGGGDVGVAGVATVVTTQNTVETLVDERASIAASGNIALDSKNDFTALSVAGGAAAGGTAGVGGAASVVTINNVTRAALANADNLANAVTINAGGTFGLSAKASENAKTFTAAGAASNNVAVGVAAAVYVLGTKTEAYVGTHARVGQTTEPSGMVIEAEDLTTLDSLAGAAAGASTVGAGAGASVGVIIKTTRAAIADNALVHSGDVRIAARSSETARTLAAGVGIGGTAGLAGALGVYSMVNTTTAEIGSNATVLADNNVAVLADDDVDISFLTGALSASGTAAVGASAAVAVIHATTTARIGSGASVTALGLGTGVNYVTGYAASLGGFGTSTAPKITAPGTTGYSAATGSDGEVTTADEALRQGLRLLVLERKTTPTTAIARGVVVNASGQNAVRSLVVGAAGGGTAGIAVSGNVPVILSNITASIEDGARINIDNAGGSGANQSVTVAAVSDVYRIGVAGSVGIGTVGVGAGVETSFIKPITSATIGSAQVNAKRDVVVTARSTQDYAGAAAAAAVAAGAAVAGGFSVLVLDSFTEARIGGIVHADGNVVVLADDITRSAALAGSAAIDIVGAGVGGSIALGVLTKRTSATIAANAVVTALGNSADVTVRDGTSFSGTRTARGVVVSANSNESMFTLGIAGAGGFYAGVAGAVSLQLLDIATMATIGADAQINATNTGANAAQDVVVVARNSSSIAAIDGGVAVSLGAGVSGAVDIGILRNTTAAGIADGAVVKANRSVDVLALQNIDTSSTVISASAGLAGIAAGVSVYSIGDGIAVGSEGSTQINSGGDMLGYVQGQLSDNTTGSVLAASSDQRVRDVGVSASAAKAGVTLSLAPTSVAGISARIGDATITSGGAVNIATRDTLNTETLAGAVAVGVVSLGAGIGIVTVESTNTAQLSGVSTLNVGSLKVDANSTHTLGVYSLAGTVGLAVAAQAAIAIITDNSITRSVIAGATVRTSNDVIVNAAAIRTGTADTRGAALSGSMALGLSYAAVNLGGLVEAKLDTLAGTGVTIGSIGARAASVAVTANSTNTAKATTKAVSGGIGIAALGALAEANSTTSVSTSANKATIYALNNARFASQSGGRAEATAQGLALGGLLAAGGSLAKAKVAEAVSTTISGGSLIDAGSVDLAASVAPILSTPGVSASASGSSGAFVGLTATEAEATNNSSANVLATGSTLRASGLIRAATQTNTAQLADASGFAFGILAVGANTSLARSATVSQAILRDMISVQGGDVRIVAEGQDRNEANTTSGSGGLIAGAAANARTISLNITRALAETTASAAQYTIQASGQLELRADHTTTFAGKVDSVQAAVVGASGATISHTANSTVEAILDDRARVRSASLAIKALSAVKNFFLNESAFSLRPGAATPVAYNPDTAAWNVDSGSGGLVNLPAGSSTVTVTHATTAAIGANGDILVVPAGSNLGNVQIEAFNETIVHQKAKLDSGGAIALADSDVRATVVSNATAAIGAGTNAIVSLGDIAMAAWGSTHIDLRSAATTYGLAGAPSGTADATYTGNNTVSIGTGATLMAAKGTFPTTVGAIPTSGTISLSAGTGLLGEAARLSVRTTVDLFNKTAIPISTTPDARSTVVVNSNLTVADSQNPANPTTLKGVLAAGDITLRAVRGTIDASAVGTGKDIYREALAAAASAISNAFGGGDVTFDYHGGTVSTTGMGTATINGLVATGIERYQTLVLNYQSNCSISTQACTVSSGNINYTIGGPDPVGTDILKRLSELKDLQAQYKDDPIAVGAYGNEIRFLQDKLVALGLGSYNTSGVFVPGTFAGPSPRDAALALAQQNTTDIGGLKTQLSTATQAVVIADLDDWGTSLKGTITDPTNGLDANARATLMTIAGFSKHSTLIGTGQGSSAIYKTTYDSVGGLITAATDAANQVALRTADNTLQQATIQLQVIEIQSAQLARQQALIDGRLGDAATAGTRIGAAQGIIDQALGTISLNNTAIDTQAALAKSKSTDVLNALNNLIILASTGAGADAQRLDDLNGTTQSPGTLAKVGRGLNGFTTADGYIAGVISLQGSLSGAATTANAAVTVLTADASSTGSVAKFITQINSLTSDLANNTRTAATAATTSGTPMAYTINVADTLARLGNISVVTDRLVGSATGSLSAPGDAKIEIINNTANTLRVGNLLIPTYDAGRLRLNGALVTSNSEINALQGGAYSNFSTVTTALGSSRPLVSITSNYNPDSLLSYNPSSSDSSLSTPRIAPDIILKQGSTIDNLAGAVKIISAAGNIYINGTVNAGSVEVLAKNGDFVSSYVNGFNHIGGDPASFNSATRAGEAGKGITANGAITIAARFININSTIQSGIADWTLNLNGSPTLTTTTPSTIGLSQSQIDTAIQGYKTAMAAAASNPANVPSSTITLTNSNGQTITLNMAPAGMSSTEITALNTAIRTYLSTNSTNSPANPLASLSVGGVTKLINLKDFLSAEISGRLEFTMAEATAYNTAAHAQGLFGVISPTSNIGVAYDTVNNRYVVDGTSVRGGFIQLYGQIMNTASSGGQLNVLDGFGTINITNTSNIPVVLQTLSAGADSSGNGRGTAGIIDITDIVGVNTSNAANPVISVKRTVYSRDYDPANASGNIRVLTQNGRLDNETGDLLIANQNTTFTGTDRTASYATTANQRYVWSTGEYFDRTTNFNVKQTQLFGSSALTISSATVLQDVQGRTLNTYRLADGTYVTTDRTQTGTFNAAQTNQGIVLSNSPTSASNTDIASTELATSSHAYMNSQDGPTKTGQRRDCNWWTLCIASNVTLYYTINQKYTVVTTNSLKADNPIGINFIGSNTGAINVTSASDVVLTGNINASNGTVAITSQGSSSIVQGDLAAQITARNVTLTAGGSAGGVTYSVNPAAPVQAAVAIDLRGGVLNASAANGNVSISTRGNLVIGQVTSAGNVHAGKGSVNLFASGSISAANASSLIQGPRVSLTAVNGSIGSTAANGQLHVNTGYSTTAGDRVFGDPATDPTLNTNPYLGLSASAAGDIGITSTAWASNVDGTMLLDKVISTGGNIRLTSTGHILDNNPAESIDQRTYSQLLGYWNSLGLVDATAQNDQKQLANIAAFKRATEQSYNQYWQIRSSQADGGTSYDASFTYHVAAGTAQNAALTLQFGNELRDANPTWTDTQISDGIAQRIADYETAQTSLYRDLNSKVGALTAAYDVNFKYVVSTTEKAALSAGSSWTQRELAFSLSPGALKAVTATNPVIKEANVSGRSITIEAQTGIGETVGAGTANVGVSIAGGMDPSLLTMDQRVALASAERSDLLLTVLYNGASVAIPLGTDYSALTPTQRSALDAAASKQIAATDMTITVLSKRPLNFNAVEALNVTVAAVPNGTLDTGTAHLASRADAPLGNINVQGETRIKTSGNIFNAASSLITTGNLILEASQGSIGSSGLALNLATGTSTFTGRAQGGVYVNFNGNGVIDTVYSPGAVSLSATGALTNANNDGLINVLGKQIALNAGTTIGTAGRALNVGNSLGGGITASAGGLINLFGPATNLFVIKSAISTTGGITLTAASNGTIDGAVRAPGRVTLTSGTGRFVLSSAAAVRSIADDVSVDGNSIVMRDGATLVADAGRVLINVTGDAQLTGVSSGSSHAQAVDIRAGGRVYAGNAAGRAYDIAALNGGVSIIALGVADKTLTATDTVLNIANPLRILSSSLALNASGGSIHVDALAAATELAATVTGSLVVTAAGTLTLKPVTTAGFQNYLAQGDITFGQLTATGPTGHITLASINGALTGTNITASGSTDLSGNGVSFGTILSGVNSRIVSTRDIIGTAQIAGNAIDDRAGSDTFAGSIRIGTIRAKTMTFDATGSLILPNLEVGETISLAGGELQVGLTQVPSGPNPLTVNLTGGKGSVGNFASVKINAPAGVIIPTLRFVDADITTTANNVTILSAYVPGQLRLTSPLQTIVANNRTPGPQQGNNIQLYQPGYAFGLALQNYHTSTNAFVVKYDASSQATVLVNGLAFDGISLVRDSVRAMFNGDPIQQMLFAIFGPKDEKDHDVEFDALQNVVVIDGVTYPISRIGDGPAVQLSLLN